MRREQLLNISAILFPRPKLDQAKAVNSLKALPLRHSLKLLKDSPNHFGKIIRSIDYILPAAYGTVIKQQLFIPSLAWGGWSKSQNKERKFIEFEVLHQTEQAPEPDNRVTLNAECDRLGRQQVHLHWCWGERDIYTIKRTQDILKEEIARAGLGELQVERDGELPKLIHPGTHNHMGTTRMHEHPKQGVVDQNCQVHGVSDLFIAGSSFCLSHRRLR